MKHIFSRVGDHSTSDDSLSYRSPEEVKLWAQNDYPNNKLKYYMISRKIWDNVKEEIWLKQARQEVLEAFNKGEKKRKPNWNEMFTDVYQYMPQNLK